MNKSGNIGSKAERAVANAANRLGFPHADRRVKRGRRDVGDVLLCPGVVVQVKGGDMARKASDALVSKWLEQTEQQRRNANAAHAFLVVQRAGVGPRNAHQWHAYWTADAWARLLGHEAPAALAGATIRTSLESSLAALVANGWGGPSSEPTRTRFEQKWRLTMTDAREALVALIPPPRVPEHVDHWPQDERDYYRHGDFSDWAERLEVLDRMRREKVADAILAAGWTPPTVKPSVEDVARAWNITEADVESLREAAVQGAAWRLLDLTCDLADREPSSEAVEDAMRDARAVLALFEKGEGRG